MRLRAFVLAAVVLAAMPVCADAAGTQSYPVSPSPSPAANGVPAPPGTSPFASPSPSPSPGPIGNGFVIINYNAGSASGGVIPSPGSTSTPAPFPSSGGTGFGIDIVGRLSPVYTAMLRFDDYALHGGDHPVMTRSDGSLFYTPGGGTLAFGIGYASLQRSSSRVSANGVGVGASLLPDLRHVLSPYVNLFFYPSAKTLGVSSNITTVQAGVIFKQQRSGILVKLGYDQQSYGNQSTSPTSLGGVQFGLGASF